MIQNRILVEEKDAQKIIDISRSFNIDAQIIGRVETSEQKQVTVMSEHGEFVY